jgi:hypothetical protein
MVKMRFDRSLGVSLIVLFVSCLSTVAQNKYWREIQGKPIVKFDWNCASTSSYPKSKLDRQVASALKHEKFAEEMPDRAFPFDLNRDGKPEYFIPLVCGAVGNCTWGVFALGPRRFLGTVNGQYIFVHKSAGRWPSVVTYRHLSAMEGIVDTYVFRKEGYRLSGKRLPIGSEDRTLEIQNVRGHKMPTFLDKASGACKDLGL